MKRIADVNQALKSVIKQLFKALAILDLKTQAVNNYLNVANICLFNNSTFELQKCKKWKSLLKNTCRVV